MLKYKLGRNPARRPRRILFSALCMARVLDTLGMAPASSNRYIDAVKVPWGMFKNDVLGDCVCADTAHTLMLRTANASQIVVPTDTDVVKLYEKFGYIPGNDSTDNGCDELSMCEYLEKFGFLGHKSDATGAIEPSNLEHVRWCIQLFGSCRIGLNFPGYAEQQFEDEQPWDVSLHGDQSTGGHDVPLVHYEGDMFYCVSWGRLQKITPAFLNRYCEEAHAEIFADWITTQGNAPSSFTLNELITKLREIET